MLQMNKLKISPTFFFIRCLPNCHTTEQASVVSFKSLELSARFVEHFSEECLIAFRFFPSYKVDHCPATVVGLGLEALRHFPFRLLSPSPIIHRLQKVKCKHDMSNMHCSLVINSSVTGSVAATTAQVVFNELIFTPFCVFFEADIVRAFFPTNLFVDPGGVQAIIEEFAEMFFLQFFGGYSNCRIVLCDLFLGQL